MPQLFNVVFAGNLSLVGPRPHALQAKAADRLYDEAVDGYFARHRVKPGITGWAQIHGWRGETNSQEKIQQRVEHDLYYIENWSILLDIYILLRDPVRPAAYGECILSERALAAAYPGHADEAAAALPQRLLNIVLFVTVLTSSIALIESFPYDGLMLVLLLTCVAARVRFDRKLVPLTLLLAIWLAERFLRAHIPVLDQESRR